MKLIGWMVGWLDFNMSDIVELFYAEVSLTIMV